MKFEMNMFTVGLIDKEGLIVNKGLIQRQMTLLNHPVIINTDKPDGIVQLGRDSIDLTYTYNIRASLESLVRVAKRREGGRIHFGPGDAYSISRELPKALHRVNVNSVFGAKGSFDKEDYLQVFRGDTERASGRTFRALLEVMKTASESPEGSLTLFVVADDSEVYLSYGRLTHVMGRMLGDVLNDNKAKTLTFENRTIQVVSKNKMDFTNHSFGKGKRINVVYDHTVQ